MQRSPVNGYIVSHRTEETAPQREASGLLLPCDRSKGKPRCRCLCPAATPQSWGSSRSLLSAPTAECRECEAGSAVLPKSKGRRSWVASQSLGSPPVSGTAVSSGSAVKRDSWVAVLGLSATSAILVLVIGMPRRGKRYRVKRTVRSSYVPCGRPSGEQGSTPLSQSGWGGPFGEQGSILCGQSRVQGRDPPGF